MSVEKRGDKWLARWRDSYGSQRSKSFSTKRDATAHLEAMNTDRRRGEDLAVPDRITVAELADRWLKSSHNLAPRTLETYDRDLTKYALPGLGNLRIGKVTPERIDAWLRSEMGNLAPSSIHRHYRTLHTMFEWAVAMRYLPRNPCATVKPPRVPHTEIETFTIDQVEAIAAEIGPRYRALVLVAGYGGLRWSELVGLRRRDIDGNAVIVAGQLQMIGGKWVRSDPKTTAGRRRVALPASVAADLERHLAEFTGPGPDDLVFVNQHGKPVGQSFRNNWYRACAAVGLGERTIKNHKPAYRNMPRFHDLRHTAVAFAIASGAHPKAIQQRLGHSSVAVTMDRYGHLMAGMDDELAQQLDSMRPT